MLALGQAWDQQAAQLILDHVRIDHPNTDVRLAVAQSLPCGVGDDDSPLRDAVIEALITLTGDEESEVRNFACFGLGQVDAASPAAKDALAARLGDSDDDTHCETLFALAKTGDSRAVASLKLRLVPSDDEADVPPGRGPEFADRPRCDLDRGRPLGLPPRADGPQFRHELRQ